MPTATIIGSGFQNLGAQGGIDPTIIVFFSLGVAAAVTSHAIRLSPIVGYIALGFALKGSSLSVTLTGPAITTLSQIGVVFLLFDVGLHFSLKHIRDRASDIFAFGAVLY